jgi:hypothetical protein
MLLEHRNAIPVLGALIVMAGGCDSSLDCPPIPCDPKATTDAVFSLSCHPTDLTSVAVSGPCAMNDASLANYVFGPYIDVSSPSPGMCHVELRFASGFTYSADVSFGLQMDSSPPGCGQCPPHIGPIHGTFTVNNPSTTCVDAGIDAGAGGLDARDDG